MFPWNLYKRKVYNTVKLLLTASIFPFPKDCWDEKRGCTAYNTELSYTVRYCGLVITYANRTCPPTCLVFGIFHEDKQMTVQTNSCLRINPVAGHPSVTVKLAATIAPKPIEALQGKIDKQLSSFPNSPHITSKNVQELPQSSILLQSSWRSS